MHIQRAAASGTQSIQRAVALLKEVAMRGPAGEALVDLARRCGIDRTTTHRILKCLVHEGLVARSREDKRYRLGSLAFELGLAAQPELDLRELSRDVLTLIAGRSGDTAFLNVRSGFDSVCLDRREGAFPVKALTVEIGGRRPLSVSASGVAMLMRLPETERDSIILENARRLAATSRVNVRTLKAVLDESFAAGYGLTSIIPGVVAIGVPICDQHRLPVGALSIAAIAERLGIGRRRELVALLRDAAADVEHAMRNLSAAPKRELKRMR